MGKDKVVEKTAEVLTTPPPSDLLFKIVPLIVGLICFAICYILFKKIQTISSQYDNITKLEKLINTNQKDQTELNNVNNKKFNAVMSHVNHVSYLLQDKMENKSNVETNVLPNKEALSNKPETNIKQPVQREFMPTSVIGSYPVENKDTLPPPKSTTTKKENLNNNVVIPEVVSDKQVNNKKIIDLQTLNEEVIIEEASSDDEGN